MERVRVNSKFIRKNSSNIKTKSFSYTTVYKIQLTMSKKNETETKYHELYAMYTHDGRKKGHKKWKFSARAYSRKPSTMVINHVLQGNIQIDRLIESWPKKVDLEVDSLTIPGTLATPLATPKPAPTLPFFCYFIHISC